MADKSSAVVGSKRASEACCERGSAAAKGKRGCKRNRREGSIR